MFDIAKVRNNESLRANTVAKPRRPRRNRQELNATIIAAATQLFSSNGYNGISIREIATEAGVALPAVYRLFENKRDLYLECCRQELKTDLPKLNQALTKFEVPEDIMFASTQALHTWSSGEARYVVMRAIMDGDIDMIKDEAHRLFESDYIKNTIKAAEALCNGNTEDAQYRLIFIHSLLHAGPPILEFWAPFRKESRQTPQPEEKSSIIVQILQRIFPETDWREVEKHVIRSNEEKGES